MEKEIIKFYKSPEVEVVEVEVEQGFAATGGDGQGEIEGGELE